MVDFGEVHPLMAFGGQTVVVKLGSVNDDDTHLSIYAFEVFPD